MRRCVAVLSDGRQSVGRSVEACRGMAQAAALATDGRCRPVLIMPAVVLSHRPSGPSEPPLPALARRTHVERRVSFTQPVLHFPFPVSNKPSRAFHALFRRLPI